MQLADPGIGRIKMQYRRTECTPPEDMQVGAGLLGRWAARLLGCWAGLARQHCFGAWHPVYSSAATPCDASLLLPGLHCCRPPWHDLPPSPAAAACLLQVSVMDYRGAGGWIRLSIDNTGGRAAVNSVSVKGGDGGDWKLLKNSWGATWEMSSAPAPPLSFKVGASASADAGGWMAPAVWGCWRAVATSSATALFHSQLLRA